MKKLLVLFSLIANLTAFNCNAQTNEVKSILWEISKDGIAQKSYLLGTFHGTKDAHDYSFLDTLPQYKSILESVDAVATETDVNEFAEFFKKSIKDIMTNNHPAYTLLPDSVKCLRDIFENEEEYLYTDSVIKEFRKNVFPLNYETLKPYYTSEVIALFDYIFGIAKRGKNYKEGFVVMDYGVNDNAEKMGKRIFYMETAKDLMGVSEDSIYMDKCSLTKQSHQLYSYCKKRSDLNNKEAKEKEGETYSHKLKELYLKQDLDAALKERNLMIERGEEQLADESFSLKKSAEDDLRVGRNKKWIPVIKENVQKSSCLIAVGALHLPGEEGLVQLLREEGYTLKPMNIFAK